MENDSTRAIIDRYLTIASISRDGWPAQRLQLNFPEEGYEFTLAEGSSVEKACECAALMFREMIEEAVAAERERCARVADARAVEEESGRMHAIASGNVGHQERAQSARNAARSIAIDIRNGAPTRDTCINCGGTLDDQHVTEYPNGTRGHAFDCRGGGWGSQGGGHR